MITKNFLQEKLTIYIVNNYVARTSLRGIIFPCLPLSRLIRAQLVRRIYESVLFNDRFCTSLWKIEYRGRCDFPPDTYIYSSLRGTTMASRCRERRYFKLPTYLSVYLRCIVKSQNAYQNAQLRRDSSA